MPDNNPFESVINDVRAKAPRPEQQVQQDPNIDLSVGENLEGSPAPAHPTDTPITAETPNASMPEAAAASEEDPTANNVNPFQVAVNNVHTEAESQGNLYEKAKQVASDAYDGFVAFGYSGSQGVREGVLNTIGLGKDIAAKTRRVISNFTGNPEDVRSAEFSERSAAAFRGKISTERKQFNNLKLVKESPIASAIGKFTGRLAAEAPIAAAGGALAGGALKGAGLLRAAGLGTDIAAGATAGALSTPEGEGSRLTGALTGGALGGGIGTLARGVGAGISKISDLARKTPQQAELVRSNIAALDKAGIQSKTIGQITGNETLQKTEDLLAKIPFIGTNRILKAQVQQADDALTGFVKGLKPELQHLNPDETVSNTLLRSMGRIHKEALKTDKALYARAATAADKAGDSSLNVLHKTIDDHIGVLSQFGTLNKGEAQLVKYLQSVKNIKTLNFSGLNNMRLRFNSIVDSVVSKNKAQGGVTKEQFDALFGVRNGIVDEMETLATSAGGKALKTFNNAQRYYKDRIAPFQDIAFKKLQGTQKVDQVLDTFIRADKPELARSLIKTLKKPERQMLEYGIAERAMDKVMKQASPSSEKIVREIAKLGKTLDVAFTPKTKVAFDGLKKALDIVFKRQTLGISRNTDVGLSAGVSTGSIVGLLYNPAIGASVVGATALLSKLLVSRTGIRLLEKLSKMPKGSPLLEKTVQSLVTTGSVITNKLSGVTDDG